MTNQFLEAFIDQKIIESLGIPRRVFQGDASSSNATIYEELSQRRLEKLRDAIKPKIREMMQKSFGTVNVYRRGAILQCYEIHGKYYPVNLLKVVW